MGHTPSTNKSSVLETWSGTYVLFVVAIATDNVDETVTQYADRCVMQSLQIGRTNFDCAEIAFLCSRSLSQR
jgi:hypothetical protein